MRPPLPAFPTLSAAKLELPEVWVGALVGGDGDMPYPLFCALFPLDREYHRALTAHPWPAFFSPHPAV